MNIQYISKQSQKLIVAAAIFLAGHSANATSINIVNFSFETDVQPGIGSTTDSIYGSYNQSITGWTITNPANCVDLPSCKSGTWNPGAGSTILPQGATNGNQVAYSTQGSISQILSSVFQANTSYTLSADVLSRTDSANVPSTLELLTAGGTLVASSSIGPIIAGGTNGLLSLSFATGASNSFLGQQIKIALLAGDHSQSNWDNVRLDATPSAVPVPAAAWLMGTALLGLVGYKRRQR